MDRAIRIVGEDSVFIGMIFLGLFALYVVALDQGLLLSLVKGAAAFDIYLIHEVLHDTRHAAGFACH